MKERNQPPPPPPHTTYEVMERTKEDKSWRVGQRECQGRCCKQLQMLMFYYFKLPNSVIIFYYFYNNYKWSCLRYYVGRVPLLLR